MTGYRFYKEENNRWYIHLQSWHDQGGSKEELEMVSGADQLLDIISQGEEETHVIFSKEPFEGAEKLFLYLTDKDDPDLGATYILFNYKEIDYCLHVWLCPVTLFVFNEYPSIIYFK